MTNPVPNFGAEARCTNNIQSSTFNFRKGGATFPFHVHRSIAPTLISWHSVVILVRAKPDPFRQSDLSFVFAFETYHIAIAAGYMPTYGCQEPWFVTSTAPPSGSFTSDLSLFKTDPPAPQMAKKKSGKIYHTGVTDAIEPQPQVSRHRGGVVRCCQATPLFLAVFLCLNQPTIRVPLPKWDWLWLFCKICFQSLRQVEKLKRQSAGWRMCVCVCLKIGYSSSFQRNLATHCKGNVPSSRFYYPFLLLNPSCSVGWPQANPKAHWRIADGNRMESLRRAKFLRWVMNHIICSDGQRGVIILRSHSLVASLE